MRGWNQERLYDAKAGTNTGEDKFELPEAGLSSGLMIRVWLQFKSALSGQAVWRIADNISKIEVAQGNVPLWSISGTQAHAFAFYNTGQLAADKRIEYAAGYQGAWIPLQWGRRFQDPKYMLDYSKYSNLELRITNTLGTTYWNETPKITIDDFTRNPLANARSMGYFRKKEYQKWTTIADETKLVKLPVDTIHRRIMLQAHPKWDTTITNDRKTNFTDLMSGIKLELGEGARVPYDTTMYELMKMNVSEYGYEPEASGQYYRTAGDGQETGIGYRTKNRVSNFNGGDAVVASGCATNDGNNSSIRVWHIGGDAGAFWTVGGQGYESTGMLRFDYEEDLSDMLDGRVDKPINLKIKTKNSSDAAGGTNMVCTDEFVPY